MGYGLFVRNGNNRIIIDSDAGYANLQVSGSGSSSPGSTFPTPGSDLIAARVSSGRVSRTYDNWAGAAEGVTSTIVWRRLSSFASLASPTGYGLNVKNSSGQLVFSATARNSSVEVLSVGTSSSTILNYSSSQLPSGYSWSNVYAVVNNTHSLVIEGPDVSDYTVHRDYTFNSSSININNWYNYEVDKTPKVYGTFAFMLVYIRS